MGDKPCDLCYNIPVDVFRRDIFCMGRCAMSLKKKKKLFNVTAWFIFLPILLGALLQNNWVMLLSIVLAVAWAVTMVIWWRCPCCGGRLLRPDMKINCCPNCGKDLGLEGDL